MSSRDNQKRLLIDEINSALEQKDSLLTPIVRKAARLASLCNDIEYRTLFDFHLEGCNSNNQLVFRGQSSPKWDIVTAFKEDRDSMENKIDVSPLEHIEYLVERIGALLLSHTQQQEPHNAATYQALMELGEAELAYRMILARIRNRVGNFVRQVEGTMIEKMVTEKIEAKTLNLPAKHCPQCKQTYIDKRIIFCTDDGTPLVSDSYNPDADTAE